MSSDESLTPDSWGQIYVNGMLGTACELAVSPLDRGLLYGDGVFDTIRVYGGRPFMLDAHLRRLTEGCSVLQIPPPRTKNIKAGIEQVLAANGLLDAYLRITVTRGATGGMWHDLKVAEPMLIVIGRPLAPVRGPKVLRTVLSRFRRDERSPLSRIKSTCFLPNILARAEAGRLDADDAILPNTRGFLAEASASNLFWVRGGRLFTPSLECGILPGVTRELLVELAKDDGIAVVEGEFAPEELCGADEAFLTNSIQEIAPVCSLDGAPFQSSPGPLAERLIALYGARTAL